MNVTEQSMLSSYASVKFYPQDKRPIMVARRATLSESEAFRNEARSAEKKKLTREETKTTLFVRCGPKHTGDGNGRGFSAC